MRQHFSPSSHTNTEPLTIDILRHYSGCENYSDEQATEIIQTLDALARIFLQAATRHGTHYDNQKTTAILDKQTDITLNSAS